MSKDGKTYMDAVGAIALDIVAKNAVEVDARGAFPRRRWTRWARPGCSG